MWKRDIMWVLENGKFWIKRKDEVMFLRWNQGLGYFKICLGYNDYSKLNGEMWEVSE